ncbi:MAG: CoA transferase [Chloroflexi bacterium]|nr:CoA transferase [Chloroflexota bacterium]
MGSAGPRRPLDDVRILDLTQATAGPYGVMLLADLGAEVIKIERPGGSDISHEFGPFIANERGRVAAGYLRYCRNRKSLTLDLKRPRARELLLDLVRVSDVVMSNFGARTMDRLGLGYEALRAVHPGIVYATASGFGSPDVLPSPYADWPAYDNVAQAMGGMMDLTGHPDGPPTECGVIVCDMIPSIQMALGVLAALHERARTGLGQQVDVAMYDAAVSLLAPQIVPYQFTGKAPTRGPKSWVCPYGVFRVRDGWVTIGASSNAQWERLARLAGREEWLADPRLRTGESRRVHYDEVIAPLLEPWLAERTRDEVVRLLLDNNVPVGPVHTISDIVNDDGLRARNMLVEIDHPVAGRYVVPGNPIKLSRHVPEAPFEPPPAVGAHTDELLAGLLGLGADEIAALRAEGVV